jgi:ribose transport system substrate-binding protein
MATRTRAIRLGGLGLSALMALAIAAPAVAQAEEMDFSDVRVAIVPGGPHPYFLPMEPGLADSVAANGLGESEFRSPPAWDLNDQNQLLNSMAAQGFNAFGIFPGDANATNAIMSELSAAGFPIMAIAGCVTEPTDAAFCFGTDVAASAYLGTKALIEAMGGEGAIMHGTGKLVDPNTTLRMDAVDRAVAETDGKVTVVEHIADIDDQENADAKINSFLAAKGDEIDGIVTTAYIPSTVSATALRNLADGRIHMVGIDDDPIVLDAIRDGIIDGTMAQNPYGQAFVGSKVLAMLKHGCTPAEDAPYFVSSGTLLISADNVETYGDDLKVLTEGIAETFPTEYLSCP